MADPSRGSCHVLRVDETGRVVWEKIYEGFFYNLCRTEKGFAMVGEKNGRVYLLNAKRDGEVEWDKIWDEKGEGIAVDNRRGEFMIGGCIEESELPLWRVILYELFDRKGCSVILRYVPCIYDLFFHFTGMGRVVYLFICRK